jgi:hypothetical protein
MIVPVSFPPALKLPTRPYLGAATERTYLPSLLPVSRHNEDRRLEELRSQLYDCVRPWFVFIGAGGSNIPN